MENNIPLATSKKIWNIVRALLFMLRKGISKKKQLMVDLNMMLKRGKIAGKAIGNLMFHHHHHHHHASGRVSSASAVRPTGPFEYEFSCSNSPADTHHHPNNFFPSFHLGKHRKSAGGGLNNFFGCAHSPQTDDVDDPHPFQLDRAVIDFLNSYQADLAPAVQASPMLPGFGRTPLVRQLRITDSPFPLKNEEEEDHGVDKAAGEFIEKFYKQLRRQ